jgi:hypothetical protein
LTSSAAEVSNVPTTARVLVDARRAESTLVRPRGYVQAALETWVNAWSVPQSERDSSTEGKTAMKVAALQLISTPIEGEDIDNAKGSPGDLGRTSHGILREQSSTMQC